MGVALAASYAFASPIGYQTHMMVFGPGGYRFTDFLRVGIPLNLLMWIAAIILIPMIWPFHASSAQPAGIALAAAARRRQNAGYAGRERPGAGRWVACPSMRPSHAERVPQHATQADPYRRSIGWRCGMAEPGASGSGVCRPRNLDVHRIPPQALGLLLDRHVILLHQSRHDERIRSDRLRPHRRMNVTLSTCALIRARRVDQRQSAERPGSGLAFRRQDRHPRQCLHRATAPSIRPRGHDRPERDRRRGDRGQPRRPARGRRSPACRPGSLAHSTTCTFASKAITRAYPWSHLDRGPRGVRRSQDRARCSSNSACEELLLDRRPPSAPRHPDGRSEGRISGPIEPPARPHDAAAGLAAHRVTHADIRRPPRPERVAIRTARRAAEQGAAGRPGPPGRRLRNARGPAGSACPTVLAAQSFKQLRDAIVAAHAGGRPRAGRAGGPRDQDGMRPLPQRLDRAGRPDRGGHERIGGHPRPRAGDRRADQRGRGAPAHGTAPSASPARHRTCSPRPATAPPSGAPGWVPRLARSSWSTAAPDSMPACWSPPCGKASRRRSTWPSAPTSST